MREADSEMLKHEYTELLQMFRHYSGLRFAILTVFFAVVAGLANVSIPAASASGTDLTVVIAIRVAGLIVTLGFWIIEMRLEMQLQGIIDAGKELEKRLSYNILLARPRSTWRVFHVKWAMALMYFCVVTLWICSLAYRP